MAASVDRGEIIHLAGRARLSPALVDGVPALVPPGETRGRCGWAPFFEALEERKLAVELDPDDPASVRLVPRGDASVRAPSARAPGMPGKAK